MTPRAMDTPAYVLDRALARVERVVDNAVAGFKEGTIADLSTVHLEVARLAKEPAWKQLPPTEVTLFRDRLHALIETLDTLEDAVHVKMGDAIKGENEIH